LPELEIQGEGLGRSGLARMPTQKPYYLAEADGRAVSKYHKVQL